MSRHRQTTTGSRFARLLQPVLDAIRELGGSARPAEVKEFLAQTGELPTDYLTAVHESGESVFGNDVDWARFYLVRTGYIDSSKRGVWTLTEKGRTETIDAATQQEILRTVDKSFEPKETVAHMPESEAALVADYQEQTIAVLRSLPPNGFERLAQRLLRESGFEEVRVSGRSGDGGIDGDGILKVNPFVSFRVLFQCKRWK